MREKRAVSSGLQQAFETALLSHIIFSSMNRIPIAPSPQQLYADSLQRLRLSGFPTGQQYKNTDSDKENRGDEESALRTERTAGQEL